MRDLRISYDGCTNRYYYWLVTHSMSNGERGLCAVIKEKTSCHSLVASEHTLQGLSHEQNSKIR